MGAKKKGCYWKEPRWRKQGRSWSAMYVGGRTEYKELYACMLHETGSRRYIQSRAWTKYEVVLLVSASHQRKVRCTWFLRGRTRLESEQQQRKGGGFHRGWEGRRRRRSDRRGACWTSSDTRRGILSFFLFLSCVALCCKNIVFGLRLWHGAHALCFLVCPLVLPSSCAHLPSLLCVSVAKEPCVTGTLGFSFFLFFSLLL
ncbi:hypothetical protein V8C26DRAFT_151383 [Trichoderma gracile]